PVDAFGLLGPESLGILDRSLIERLVLGGIDPGAAGQVRRNGKELRLGHGSGVPSDDCLLVDRPSGGPSGEIRIIHGTPASNKVCAHQGPGRGMTARCRLCRLPAMCGLRLALTLCVLLLAPVT